MRRLHLLIAATGLCAGYAMPGWSQDSGPASREDQIKAGYLFNFAKFVDWPASALSDPLTVCFIGAAGIQESFRKDLEDKRIGTRRLAVRALRDTHAIEECNVLYLDGALPARVFKSFEGASLPILTVSDATNFTQHGGIISLYTENNRLHFIVNIQNAARAQLHISSNLLQLASAVEKGDSR